MFAIFSRQQYFRLDSFAVSSVDSNNVYILLSSPGNNISGFVIVSSPHHANVSLDNQYSRLYYIYSVDSQYMPFFCFLQKIQQYVIFCIFSRQQYVDVCYLQQTATFQALLYLSRLKYLACFLHQKPVFMILLSLDTNVIHGRSSVDRIKPMLLAIFSRQQYTKTCYLQQIS